MTSYATNIPKVSSPRIKSRLKYYFNQETLNQIWEIKKQQPEYEEYLNLSKLGAYLDPNKKKNPKPPKPPKPSSSDKKKFIEAEPKTPRTLEQEQRYKEIKNKFNEIEEIKELSTKLVRFSKNVINEFAEQLTHVIEDIFNAGINNTIDNNRRTVHVRHLFPTMFSTEKDLDYLKRCSSYPLFNTPSFRKELLLNITANNREKNTSRAKKGKGKGKVIKAPPKSKRNIKPLPDKCLSKIDAAKSYTGNHFDNYVGKITLAIKLQNKNHEGMKTSSTTKKFIAHIIEEIIYKIYGICYILFTVNHTRTFNEKILVSALQIMFAINEGGNFDRIWTKPIKLAKISKSKGKKKQGKEEQNDSTTVKKPDSTTVKKPDSSADKEEEKQKEPIQDVKNKVNKKGKGKKQKKGGKEKAL